MTCAVYDEILFIAMSKRRQSGRQRKRRRLARVIASPLTPSPLVPRRAKGVMGPKPRNYPDLNFQALGHALDVNPTYVGRIMNGVKRPSLKFAQRLAAYMGWTLDQVVGLYRSEGDKNDGES